MPFTLYFQILKDNFSFLVSYIHLFNRSRENLLINLVIMSLITAHDFLDRLTIAGKLNPLTPRVKPSVIDSFLTFDSVDRTLHLEHSLETC